MKHIESRYPLNENRTDLDRAALYALRKNAKYPNFVSMLAFSPLPIPTLAEAARISPDVLIDCALGLDSLTTAESYFLRAALGLSELDPVDESALYAAEEAAMQYDAADWSEVKAALAYADKPLKKHPAHALIAPFLDKSTASYRVAISVLEWLDFAGMKYHKNTRRKPL